MTNKVNKEVDHEATIEDRFEFGKNWLSFVQKLDDVRVQVAIDSLKEMLEVDTLKGMKFLDIGSGSGLFSLAAVKLGAEVFSFDYDKNSVSCTRYLRDNYSSESQWKVEQGSVLDKEYLESLGDYDIVYSWGVLHHTGSMYEALENAVIPLKNGGKLFIAIYNDEGAKSKAWKKLKRMYVQSKVLKGIILGLYTPYYILKNFLMDVLYLRQAPLARYKNFREKRGMSWIHDLYDWLGGYPFEVASIPQIFDFYKKRNLSLEMVTARKGRGCNQFVFKKMI
tara:strand:+ start:18567 stop:19406 length:840 start_codon:yes stop_codon:yes gene_type:complete